jgi:microcystin-dependent protein
MSDPYLGEIRIFAFNFAPQGWQVCDGSLLQVTKYSQLFGILGTTYGGNGTANFAVPNLRDSAPVHFGKGPNLSERHMGEIGGVTDVTLTMPQMPSHNHVMQADPNPGNVDKPSTEVSLARSGGGNAYLTASNNPQPMSSAATNALGGGQSHTNQMPSLVLNFCIALDGTYPGRN